MWTAWARWPATIVFRYAACARPLFDIADISHMWLTLAVRQDDAQHVTLGLPVLFRPSEGNEASVVRGKVAWISAAADSQTRTVKVRVELPNADGRLRANTFG